MNAVPFRIPSGQTFFADVEGLLRLQDEGLVLEFRTIDALVGVFKSRAKEVLLVLDDVESVQFRRGWFGDRVSLTARRMAALESIPGARGSEITVRCRRKHRAVVEELVANLRLRIAEAQLEELGRGTARG